jgi:hypothetical protein
VRLVKEGGGGIHNEPLGKHQENPYRVFFVGPVKTTTTLNAYRSSYILYVQYSFHPEMVSNDVYISQTIFLCTKQLYSICKKCFIFAQEWTIGHLTSGGGICTLQYTVLHLPVARKFPHFWDSITAQPKDYKVKMFHPRMG